MEGSKRPPTPSLKSITGILFEEHLRTNASKGKISGYYKYTAEYLWITAWGVYRCFPVNSVKFLGKFFWRIPPGDCFDFEKLHYVRFHRKAPLCYPEVFCKIGVLKNFAKFAGNSLFRRGFFNKVASVRPAILIEKSLRHRIFSREFCKIF